MEMLAGKSKKTNPRVIKTERYSHFQNQPDGYSDQTYQRAVRFFYLTADHRNFRSRAVGNLSYAISR